jgi:hypothetical protein
VISCGENGLKSVLGQSNWCERWLRFYPAEYLQIEWPHRKYSEIQENAIIHLIAVAKGLQNSAKISMVSGA